MPSAQVSASSDRGRFCVRRARRPLLRRARWVQAGASGSMSGIAGSAGQRPVGALPGRFRPAAAGPKLGVSLCPPAQFTLALAGKLFPHVQVHGPHVVWGRRARASALARTTSGSRGSGGSASVQERSRRALGFWIRIRFTVISSAMSGPAAGRGPALLADRSRGRYDPAPPWGVTRRWACGWNLPQPAAGHDSATGPARGTAVPPGGRPWWVARGSGRAGGRG
jgi:hypothetical protein